MTRHRKRSLDEIVAVEVQVARILNDHEHKAAFAEKMAPLWRSVEANWIAIRESAEARGAGRGEKWTASYEIRKARERAEEFEAMAAAIRADQASTSCPAG